MSSIRKVVFLLMISFGVRANVLETSKVKVPEFEARVNILAENSHLDSVLLELRTEFIECVVACKYKTESESIVLDYDENEGVVLIQNFKLRQKTFRKMNARLNECGASLILIISNGENKYYSRINLFEKQSTRQKNSCSEIGAIKQEIDRRTGNTINLDDWRGPI